MCDWAEVYDARFRRARKDHVCAECGRTVRDGERYQYTSGRFDGDWFETKLCVRCAGLHALVRTKWGPDLECGSASLGDLRVTVDEMVDHVCRRGRRGKDGGGDCRDHKLSAGERVMCRSLRDAARPLDELEALFPAPVSETTT